MKFLPLIDLRLRHAYYADGRCPDFLIEPTPETQRLFKKHRCVLKSVPDGIRVLTAVTDGAQFIPLATGVTFAFHLRLRNRDFALFTDLTEITQAPAPLYTNVDISSPANPIQLNLVSRQAWSTESFAVREPIEGEHFILRGRPLAESQPKIEESSTINNLKYIESANVIAVNSSAASKDDPFKITYETSPQLEKDVFAMIEIHHNDSLPEVAAGPGAFQIAFKAKEARWKYYVIVDNNKATFHTEVKDADLGFSDDNRTDLNKKPDSSDDVARTLAERFPQMQRLRFVSDDLIPCREQARKSIQLCLDGKQVMSALPNPSLRNYATMEVTENGNPHMEDSLFQVIKYFTH